MPHDFTITTDVLANRTVFQAQLTNSPEPKFVVGRRTVFKQENRKFFGLVNDELKAGQEIYDPALFAPQFDFWAFFIYPTAMAESKGSYWCLNTYDKAKFTFSFMQYAAHVPNGDFVVFFKKLLTLPNGADYFPGLVLQNGRIFNRTSSNGLEQLENDASTQKLMDYLNPTLNDVENEEKISAAKMVHWARTDAANRRIQVETAIDHFKKKMIEYDRLYRLDGMPAKICQVICDIRHQGRASNKTIIQALNTGGDLAAAFNKLSLIGATKFPDRIDTVKKAIRKLETAGLFSKKYNRAGNTFVNM